MLDRVGAELGIALVLAVGRAIADGEILSLDVAELAQALAQRGEVGGVRRGRLALEHGDAVDLVLRRRGERGKQYQ